MSDLGGSSADTGVPALSRAVVDRAARYRPDTDYLAARWAAPDTRVLVVEDGAAAVTDGAAGPELVLLAPAQAPSGLRLFLGEEGSQAYFAVLGCLPRALGVRPAGLRDVGALLDDRHAGLFVHAVALANWHQLHPHCPRCGGPTESGHGGHVRTCTRDGSAHFPRTDPAVIMLVHDGADACVLGRQPSWPPRRFSTLAGFVEPGESAEQAVAREVAEEVGLRVTDISYRASQPWPFPASLMLGFTARATDTDIVVDRTELDDARWFGRPELADAVEDRQVLLPPPVSIAYRLIRDWLTPRLTPTPTPPSTRTAGRRSSRNGPG